MKKHSEEYKRYMRSRDWEHKRQRRLEVDGHKCVMCGRPESKCRNGLQVHHISYTRLGNEDVGNDLVSLCPGCHKKIHNYYGRNRLANSVSKVLTKKNCKENKNE